MNSSRDLVGLRLRVTTSNLAHPITDSEYPILAKRAIRAELGSPCASQHQHVTSYTCRISPNLRGMWLHRLIFPVVSALIAHQLASPLILATLLFFNQTFNATRPGSLMSVTVIWHFLRGVPQLREGG